SAGSGSSEIGSAPKGAADAAGAGLVGAGAAGADGTVGAVGAGAAAGGVAPRGTGKASGDRPPPIGTAGEGAPPVSGIWNWNGDERARLQRAAFLLASASSYCSGATASIAPSVVSFIVSFPGAAATSPDSKTSGFAVSSTALMA